jgi:hypothetical protein
LGGGIEKSKISQIACLGHLHSIFARQNERRRCGDLALDLPGLRRSAGRATRIADTSNTGRADETGVSIPKVRHVRLSVPRAAEAERHPPAAALALGTLVILMALIERKNTRTARRIGLIAGIIGAALGLFFLFDGPALFY